MKRTAVLDGFRHVYNHAPQWIARAPGRVNLIGEHTDYNEGFVLPMAIPQGLWIALRPRDDRRVRLHSLDFGTDTAFDLDHLTRSRGWAEYVKGVAWALERSGLRLRGFDGAVSGDVPRGAGLSSSAALELAAARAFAAASGLDWDPAAMARLCLQAEVEWIGLDCGIMDQMASACARAGHALWLDCRTLETEQVPLPAGARVVILDTGTRRGLVDSDYNQRHDQCRAAARFFGVPALRDVSMAAFAAEGDRLDQLIRRRARHVISENGRVQGAATAMRAGDLETLGGLLDASHRSLRDDFEVSSPELDRIVAAAKQQSGCYGARMTGAGFGGCALALVAEAAVDEFIPAVLESFGGQDARAYVVEASPGASLEKTH